MLILADGTTFKGTYDGPPLSGELVFTTSMTGYQEAITDPSYAGQILVFSYPLIGNYGLKDEFAESRNIHPVAIVVSKLTSDLMIPTFILDDTRPLVLYLRTHGSQMASINGAPLASMAGLVRRVVSDHTSFYPNENAVRNVTIIDCGNKNSVINALYENQCTITSVPYNVESIGKCDAVIISNGPGNPQDVKETIQLTKHLVKKGYPIFGICLGHQLVALSQGMETRKMQFGHRGSNHPVMNMTTRKCLITTQNHGYCVTEAKKGWSVLYENVNDGTIEGLQKKKVTTVQFHPEGRPGPRNEGILTDWLNAL